VRFPGPTHLVLLARTEQPAGVAWEQLQAYFRVGNSNRTFHKVDWAVRSELQLWLRRKHRCPWRTARKRWGCRFLHDRCRLYPIVGKVSHLERLRRTPDEDDRRAGCAKTARPVR
jgi:hypothetical protein